MAKTHGAAGAALTEAPREAAIEPATQPIVADAGSDPLGYVQMAMDRPSVNERSRATDEAIARRAYELYQARGGVDGADMEDWLQAERELRAGDGPADERDNPGHRPID